MVEVSEEKNKYFCIFGGGAMRGLAYIGALSALEELKINIDAYAGSSIGALFAATMAIGVSVESLKNIFLPLNLNLFKDLNFSFSPELSLSKGELFYEKMKEIIEENFYKENYKKGKNSPVTFKDIDKDLYIYSTNLTKCKLEIFSKKTTPEMEIALAVRLSASMPGLMRNIELNGDIYTDGDLFKGRPLWRNPVLDISPDTRILEFRLEGYSNPENSKTVIDYITQVYSCMTMSSTDYIIDLYNNRDKFDYIKINTGDILFIDMNLPKKDRLELIQIGYDTTYNYFTKILPNKKKQLVIIYQDILLKIQEVQKAINKKKYLNAKIKFADLFFNLSEYKKIIDVDTYNSILKCKDLFVSNLSKAPLLEVYNLKNISLIISSINILYANLENKLTELEEFINTYT